MKRAAFTLVLCAAIYGFCAGCVHSLEYGLHNLIKFPLLLLITASVCAVAYYVVAAFFGARLRFSQVQALSFSLFRDAAVLLASFSTVALFLATTIERPDARGIHEYPLFLAVNVVLIAVAGTTALLRQARSVVAATKLSPARGRVLVGAWLALSLFVGSQTAWFLRPFFGVASISAAETPFFLGSAPDFRGATSFYEALWHVVSPPVRSAPR